MGWDYVVTRYFGHLVNARKTGKEIIDKIRKEYGCDYTDSDKLPGNTTILFYVYEEEIDADHASYMSRGPDTTGTVFREARHPTYFKELDGPPPDMSENDINALAAISKECVIEKKLGWYEIAQIYY